MTALYNAVYDDMKECGITKIMCNTLFEQYRSEFQNSYNQFKCFLMYLEKCQKIRIVRFDFDDNLFHSIEIL